MTTMQRPINFREISMGNIAPKVLYRSNHPINKGQQVEAIISAVTKANIKTIINLSDSNQSLESRITCCPWYQKMVKENNVIPLNMSMDLDLTDSTLICKIGQAIMFMIEHEAPYLIHCEAGMDRAGLMSILMESFMEAPFDDIVKDYMLSFVDSDDYSASAYQHGAGFLTNLFSGIKGAVLEANEDLHPITNRFFTETVKLDKNVLKQLKTKLMAATC